MKKQLRKFNFYTFFFSVINIKTNINWWKVELFMVRVLKFPSHPIKCFSLFIASQLAVVQLAHFDLIPSISEEFHSKSLSFNMIALSTGIICAAT